MSGHVSDGCRFVCYCGAAYPNLAGMVGHYASLHPRPQPVPDNRRRQSVQAITDGLALVADCPEVACVGVSRARRPAPTDGMDRDLRADEPDIVETAAQFSDHIRFQWGDALPRVPA